VAFFVKGVVFIVVVIYNTLGNESRSALETSGQLTHIPEDSRIEIICLTKSGFHIISHNDLQKKSFRRNRNWFFMKGHDLGPVNKAKKNYFEGTP
jgi:hypothetical protein